MAVETKSEKSIDKLTIDMSELTVLSFRKVEELQKVNKHLAFVIQQPETQKNQVILNYIKNLHAAHRKIFLQKRDCVEVEYIFTTEKKSSIQRQRFNSLQVSEIPELLKAELLNAEHAQQVHICTDCNVEIEINDEEPLMECLQKHFNLEVHQPKLKRESIDVSEPIMLPNMSRRLSAMECGETPAQTIDVTQLVKPMEKLDRAFAAKLEAALIRYLPDNSEASIDAAAKFYQVAYDKLCKEIAVMDFSSLTGTVAPIIMSIKDNVNQNFAADANKNVDNDENEQAIDKFNKTQKKYRYYAPIEALIVKLLMDHKLLSLVDDRTGKLAFFCVSCEYYTLRFRYDSVLNHVFSDTHIHNLSAILEADKNVPFSGERSINNILNMNHQFFTINGIIEENSGLNCGLCKNNLEKDGLILHLLDENHLAKLSEKICKNDDIKDLGPKALDWTKYLASVGKTNNNNRDHVIIENFIKQSGKIANYCSCCDMTLKGPRQVLFNHVRQKKHLRNAAPHKLSLLYKNHCRPVEYYASFGNFYVCSICPKYIAVPSFASIVEHFESTMHVESVAKLIRTALYSEIDQELLLSNKISVEPLKCNVCGDDFQDFNECINHVFSNIRHQNAVVDSKMISHRGDIMSVYMGGNYILHSEGLSFTCDVCKNVFNSIRSLLMHLVYAGHFNVHPTPEDVFRFYLELKHNINMWGRNKYEYYEFGKLKCGVCNGDIEDGENAKRHVTSTRHRENMGAGYMNVVLDAATNE